MLPPDEGSVATWLPRTRADLFTSADPVLFDPMADNGVSVSMLKDAQRRLHVRVDGLPGRVYHMHGDIPPVDQHGLFVCVRWTPTYVDLFLGPALARRIMIATH